MDRMASKNDASPPFRFHDQLAAFHSEAFVWLEAHWLQIVIAVGAGLLIYLMLNLSRRWGVRLCQRGAGGQNWYAVLGRAIAKTSQWFIVLAAARLVVGYSNAPPSVGSTCSSSISAASASAAPRASSRAGTGLPR
jgi:hypothetical protein